jgi:predicted ArsR family transcriptional regulator
MKTDWEAIGKCREAAGLVENAPPEAVTAQEYADKFGLTLWVAKQELKKLVAEGKVNVGRKAVKTAGRRYLKEAYWLKK